MEARKIKKTLIAALLLIGGVSMAKAEGIQFNHISLKEAISKAKTENKLVFVDVFTTWCGPCKYLSTKVFTDKQVGAFYNENFVCIKVDAERGEGPTLMSRFDVDAYPTLLYLDENGNLLQKKEGAGGTEHLLYWGETAVHPEESIVYQAKEALKTDPSSKELMVALIEAQSSEGIDPTKTVLAYHKQYPELDLNDPNDLLVFLHSETSLEDPLMQQMLSMADALVVDHQTVVGEKVIEVLDQELSQAVQERSPERLDKALDQLYAAYALVFGEEAFEKDILQEKLREMYNDQVN